MEDEEILKWAFHEGRVLVTNDKDFGRFVFLLHQAHAGLIRLPSAHGCATVSLMRQILAKHSQDLLADVVITATSERIRIRKTHIP
jgi:predicted nuclease of predicted toxin-antitoxin system